VPERVSGPRFQSSTGRSYPYGGTFVTMQQLLESGAHFGHQTHRWNPKMKPYIFGDRNGIHIIDLSQTVPLFARALEFVNSTVARAAKCCSSHQASAQEAIATPRAVRTSISSITAAGACSPIGRRSPVVKLLRSRGAASGDTIG